MLSILEYLVKKTESDEVKSNDAETFLPIIFLILNNENPLLKSKASNLFQLFMDVSSTHR